MMIGTATSVSVSAWEASASQALKAIARNEKMKSQVQRGEGLYPLLSSAARRFVVGETREEAISEASELLLKGYGVSLECIRENVRDVRDCISAKDEFLAIIRTVGQANLQSTVSLDLSYMGMNMDPQLTYEHLLELAQEAERYGITIMISAEESTKIDQIINIYKRIGEQYANVGITLQAHLHRTLHDYLDIQAYPGKIRIVKGAYQEAADVALPRSEELNERYLDIVEMVAASGRQISIATHDEAIIEKVVKKGYLQQPNVEIEMLYGVRPERLKELKDEGYRTKVYVLYGVEWYLYVCHRLAEHPPNIYKAIEDMANFYAETEKESLY
ncbi:proline dehydrogenase family protein [Paenibacillus assamensis]|uniref:proline dehydrogenase family protein n=1 Tax=Paenibacillus assamensis TaxID=311244 RepID=UPI0003FE65D8|nr:proline dehydrogenase family protein [Paenibacillus assamensis]